MRDLLHSYANGCFTEEVHGKKSLVLLTEQAKPILEELNNQLIFSQAGVYSPGNILTHSNMRTSCPGPTDPASWATLMSFLSFLLKEVYSTLRCPGFRPKSEKMAQYKQKIYRWTWRLFVNSGCSWSINYIHSSNPSVKLTNLISLSQHNPPLPTVPVPASSLLPSLMQHMSCHYY